MVFWSKAARFLGLALSLALALGVAALGWGMTLPAELPALRFLSFAVRDTPPTAEEANALAGGGRAEEAVANWLGSEEHRFRVHRFFNDLLGVRDGVTVAHGHYVLNQTAEGVYTLPDKAGCTAAEAVSVEAWWLASTERALVCPTVISKVLSLPSGRSTLVCTLRGGDWGMGDPRCGCGPLLVGCLPRDLLGPLRDSVRLEFANRGLHAYETGDSWLELVGGDSFYGNRLLYWRYLYTQKILKRGLLPTADELATLTALPVDDWAEAPFPKGGVPRAGIITAPGFLSHYPNFRARTRALVEAFLCRKIDGTLNTHDLKSYRNLDLGKIELEHAARSDCAACHFPLDNLGSLLLGYDGSGLIDPLKSPSQIGVAFGVEDTGPAGMARLLVNQSPWFHECMAKRAWESFAGRPFAELATDDRLELVAAAHGGPRSLIQRVLTSTPFSSLRPARPVEAEVAAAERGMPEPLPPPPPPPPPVVNDAVTFAEVNPIFHESCGGNTCHGQGSSLSVFTDNEGTVRKRAAAIKDRIGRTGAGRMPPSGSGRGLSEADRQLILRFLG